MAEKTIDQWLDALGAVAHSGTSLSTVLRAARAGKLQGYRINGNRVWRFRASAVDAWIESGTPDHLEKQNPLRLANR